MSFFQTNLPVEKVVTPTTAELRGSMIWVLLLRFENYKRQGAKCVT